jgi:hypothetical protein
MEFLSSLIDDEEKKFISVFSALLSLEMLLVQCFCENSRYWIELYRNIYEEEKSFSLLSIHYYYTLTHLQINKIKKLQSLIITYTTMQINMKKRKSVWKVKKRSILYAHMCHV